MTANLSAEARAIVRAAESLTTQVRRIADALSTPVVGYEVAADDAPTTTDDGASHRLAQVRDAARLHRQQLIGTPELYAVIEASDVTTTDAATCDQNGPWGDAHACIRPRGHTDGHEALDGCQWEQAPAADEDAQRTARRVSLRILLGRLDRHVTGADFFTPDEAGLLRQHVETEMREADRARQQAVRLEPAIIEQERLAAELEQAQAAIKRVRDYVAAATEATTAGTNDYDIGRHDLARTVFALVNGTEQPTESS